MTRLINRPTEDGQYRLEPMTEDEISAFESELNRSDFTEAHGPLTPELFDALWARQQGLCAQCAKIMDPAQAFYEEGILCDECSSVLTVRRIDNPAAYVNEGARPTLLTRKVAR